MSFNIFLFFLSVDNVTILLGSRSVMVRKMLISDKICIHPNYTNGVIRGKDIALIHLPTEMTINSNLDLMLIR